MADATGKGNDMADHAKLYNAAQDTVHDTRMRLAGEYAARGLDALERGDLKEARLCFDMADDFTRPPGQRKVA